MGEEQKKSGDANPFSALFGKYNKDNKTQKANDEKNKSATKKIAEDNYYEKILRKLSEEKAKENCYNIFEIYKKAHLMASP